MPNRAELEQQLVQEIHYLPLEAIESLLKLACLIKKETSAKPMLQADNFVEFMSRSQAPAWECIPSSSAWRFNTIKQ